MRSLLTAAFLTVAATGCHSVALGTQPFDRRAEDPPPPDVFSVDWRVKLVGPQFWEYFPREPAQPAVDAETGRVVVATRDGVVRAINPEAQVEWSFKTADPFIAGPTIRDGVVYVPGGDGVLYALRLRDGSELWRYDTGEQLATAPLVTEGRVFVASHANALYAVDRASGKWLWQYRRDLPSGFMIQGASHPVLAMGTLYIGFADGYVVALDPGTGTAKWEKALSASGSEFLDVDTTPIVDDAGRLIVASYKDGLFALDPDTGDVEWNTVRPGITGILQRGEVVFTTGDQGVGAILAENGRRLWEIPLKDRAAHRPVFARGLLVVPVDDALMFIDPATGSPRLSWDPGDGVTAPAAWGNFRLYVLSNNGWLYALRMTGGG